MIIFLWVCRVLQFRLHRLKWGSCHTGEGRRSGESVYRVQFCILYIRAEHAKQNQIVFSVEPNIQSIYSVPIHSVGRGRMAGGRGLGLLVGGGGGGVGGGFIL